MSSSLEQLIQISKFKIDEKRRKISMLRDFAERVQHNLNELDAEMAHEMALDDKLAPFVFKQTYMRAAQERKGNLVASLKKVDVEIEDLSEQLQSLFMEMKRYELAHTKREQTRYQTLNRKRSQAMDEIAARSGAGAY